MIKGETLYVDDLNDDDLAALIGRRVVATSARSELSDFHQLEIGKVSRLPDKDDGHDIALFVDFDVTGEMGIFNDEFIVVLSEGQ